MKYRTYPNTDLSVSELGFGMWTTSTGWWGEMTDGEAVKLIHEAYDLGVTLYDAADTYGDGRSEEQLRKAFSSSRDKVIYATKFGYDWYTHSSERRGQNELPQDVSPAFIRKACEESLRRLGTDYIDIYQLHNAKMEHVHNAEMWETLEALKREGKIRMGGIALGPAIGFLYEGVDSVKEHNCSSLQIIWNALEQYPGNEQIKAAYDSNADTGYMIRVPHASGMLEGHYTEDTVFPEGDHRRHRPRSWLVNGVKKVEQLRFLATGDRTLGQASMQWLLREPKVMTILPNIYDREQLVEFAKASEVAPLTQDEYDRIQELYAGNFGIEEPPMNFKGVMTRDEVTAQ